jgi:hypothetical protein
MVAAALTAKVLHQTSVHSTGSATNTYRALLIGATICEVHRAAATSDVTIARLVAIGGLAHVDRPMTSQLGSRGGFVSERERRL